MPHCSDNNAQYGGDNCVTLSGGNLHIRHSNRKIHKKKRKTLRKFLSKKRRGLLNTLKRTFKYKQGNKKRKSKSQKKRRPMKKRKSAKKRMRGGGALSPAVMEMKQRASTLISLIRRNFR